MGLEQSAYPNVSNADDIPSSLLERMIHSCDGLLNSFLSAKRQFKYLSDELVDSGLPMHGNMLRAEAKSEL